MGYAWPTMSCATTIYSLSTGMCILSVRVFARTSLWLKFWLSATTLLYTSTNQRTLTPRVLCSLPSVPLTQGNAYESLFPECLWYVSQRQFFFQQPIYLIRVHMIWYIGIEERFGSTRISLGLGLDNSQQNAGDHIAAIGFHSSLKTDSVLDGSTCEHMSMTLLLVWCRPDITSIQTSPTFTTLLSCPG